MTFTDTGFHDCRVGLAKENEFFFLKVAREFRLRTSFGKLYQIFAPLYWKLDFPYLVLHVGRGSASLLSLRPLRLYLESQSTNSVL